jgi:hypothetical protein
MLPVDVEGLKCLGESMQNGVAAHAMLQGPIRVTLEALKHGNLLRSMQGVNDFVGKSNKSINVVDRFSKARTQKSDA